MNVDEIIKYLQLEPLPQEGGYFRQTWISAEMIPQAACPERYRQDMPMGTAIYALLTRDNFSAIHKLSTDEVYHFYAGDPLEILLLYPEGEGEVLKLGNDLLNDMQPQCMVPRDVWQGSLPQPDGEYGYSLIGTSMAPGFIWEDFTLGTEQELVSGWPEYAEEIRLRTRNK